MERSEEMTNINELDDEQLKELYSCVRTPEVRDEVFKRIAERCPITSTNKKLDDVKQLANGTYSFDRFCYRTPYSCMVNGKRTYFHSLNEMYYRLTGDDNYYKEEYTNENGNYVNKNIIRHILNEALDKINLHFITPSVYE